MFRCDATTTTGERLTLYGHCDRPQVALRMARESWQHQFGVEVANVTIYRCDRQGKPLGKPVTTWERPE